MVIDTVGPPLPVPEVLQPQVDSHSVVLGHGDWGVEPAPSASSSSSFCASSSTAAALVELGALARFFPWHFGADFGNWWSDSEVGQEGKRLYIFRAPPFCIFLFSYGSRNRFTNRESRNRDFLISFAELQFPNMKNNEFV